MSDERREVLLSALNHYLYCRRRCALIHIARIFEENLHTQRGRREHERVDRVEHETEDGVVVERSLPLWCNELGLMGRADVVELHPDGEVLPVEYKHGRRKQWDNDDVQLCAQALCLEEMLGRPVSRGAIFHRGSRRRREVRFDEVLRALTRRTVSDVRELLERGVLPPPKLTERCGQCSLRDECMPEVGGSCGVEWLFSPLEERDIGE